MADRALRFDLLGRDKTLGRTLSQGEGKLRRFGGSVTRVGGLLAGAFAGVAVIAGIKSTIDAASDLNESLSKSRVVFGKAARGVEAFAKTAAKNLGQSRREALEATATFGNLFVSMKLGQKPAADMSVKLVRLASDLASFNNVNPAEALEALRSGLVGETEPLRRFGINLNDADLRQRALALGLTKTTKSVLPPAIRAQAAYSLIMEQSKTAQGDFARTADGAANRQRILRARVEDLKASLGRGLLPAYAAVLGFLTDRFIPIVSRLGDKIIPPLRDALRGIGARVGPLLEAIQEKFDDWKLDAKIFGQNLASRIKGTAQAVIVGFQAGLKAGDWGQLGGILGNILRTAIGNGVDLIKRAFGGVDWFKVGKEATFIAVPFAFGFFDSLLSALVKQFKEHPWESTFAVLSLIPLGRAAGVLAKALGRLPILGGLLRALERAGALLERPVGAVVGAVVRFFGAAIDRAFPAIGKRIGEWALRWILGITSKYTAMRKAGGTFIRGLLDGILDQAGLVIRNIAQVIGWLTRPFRAAGGWLVRRGFELISGLVRGIASMLGSVVRWMGRVKTSLLAPFATVGNWLWQRGRDLISGLTSGIRSALGAVGGVLRSLKDAIVGGIKRLFGIASPSRVMAGLGASMVAGLVRGLVGNAGSLRAVIKSIGGNIVDWFGGIFGGIGQGGAVGGIQQLAQRMAAGYGWTGAQWNALRTLVQNESGWNPNAQNPTSTAYGLFQFLNSTWAGVGAAKTSSPVGQIAAGLRYIKGRYGSPINALNFWMSHIPHWYGSGGIFTKPAIIGVGEAGPEAVVPLGRGGGFDYDRMAEAFVRALERRPPTVAVSALDAGVRTYQRARGKAAVGFG